MLHHGKCTRASFFLVLVDWKYLSVADSSKIIAIFFFTRLTATFWIFHSSFERSYFQLFVSAPLDAKSWK